MLELHVWGPAFTLPSIDPQCLAAIAYCKQTLQLNDWSIVASSNPLLSPDKYLPALRDGRQWVSGFRGIVEYLRQRNPSSDIDSILSDRERAESVALMAYIETHLQNLYDLSLFVAWKNFENVTRPLYSQLLPFPVQYYTPLSLRSSAKARTEGLGIPIEQEPLEEPQSDPRATATEAAARNARTPITSKLQTSSPEVFYNSKLAALCDAVFSTLRKRLGDQKYFYGAAPSSIDCLAVGYLSLLLFPELPLPFARDALMREKRLPAYVHDLRPAFLGPSISPEDVLAGRGIPGALPISKVERGDVPWLTGVAIQKIKQAVDIRSYFPPPAVEPEELDDPMMEEQMRKVRETRRAEWWKSFFTVAAGITAFGAYVIWSGLISIQFGDDEEEVEAEIDAGGMSAESILGAGLGIPAAVADEDDKDDKDEEEEDEDEEVVIVEEDDDDDDDDGDDEE